MKNNKLPLLFATLVMMHFSCKKDDVKIDIPKVTTGFYVLNEGIANQNNTTLTYYDFSTAAATNNFYKSVNGSDLGDTGNDMIIYGSNLYIVMNISSYLEVADAITGISKKKIEFTGTGGAKRYPRNIVAYKNKLLVSSTDGTVAVVDTASLTIDQYITVGTNPEQLVVSGEKLYVANSGGFNYPDVDSTVSVIDLNSLMETKKITVGLNPWKMASDNNGNVFVATLGNFSDVPAQLFRISTSNDLVAFSADTTANTICFFNNQLYVTSGYGSEAGVRVLNTSDFSFVKPSFIADGTLVTTPYGLAINESNGDVYVTDAKDYKSPGEVFCFDKDGKKKFSFSVTPGISPNKLLFIKQ